MLFQIRILYLLCGICGRKKINFYVNKFNDLMKVSGYYIYYEKNPAMQNYMIASRRKNGLTISESVEDRAAKKFSQPDSYEGGVRRSKTVNSFYAYRQFVFDLSHAGDGDNDDE